MNQIPKRKKVFRRMRCCIIILLVSLLLINIISPSFRVPLDEECKERIDQTEYEADTVSSERIACIDDNEDALLWRLRMIAAAKESIVLTTFDLRDDNSGTDVMAALYDAAERGVKVQLLVDGIYTFTYLSGNGPFQALTAHENAQVRIYNPVTAKIYPS